MGELLNKETIQGIEQLTHATAAMSSMMDPQESARIMVGGLERHQHVNAKVRGVVNSSLGVYFVLNPINHYCS
jgi:hypothetical protein